MRAKQTQRHMSAQEAVSSWLDTVEQGVGLFAKQGVLKVYAIWLAIALGIGLLSWQGHKIVALFDHPIERIEVSGDFQYLNEQALQNTLQAWIQTSFLGADLLVIKSQVEALPWVRTATVHRVWPGQIVLEIEEQTAVANWGDQAYLNEEGEIFSPETIAWDQQRPRLLAEMDVDQVQRQEMLAMMQQINALLENSGLKANQLIMDPRGTWQLGLQKGPTIILGAQPIDNRLERAAKVYSQLQGDAQLLVDKIDARYPNGVAVRWKEMALASTESGSK